MRLMWKSLRKFRWWGPSKALVVSSRSLRDAQCWPQSRHTSRALFYGASFWVRFTYDNSAWTRDGDAGFELLPVWQVWICLWLMFSESKSHGRRAKEWVYNYELQPVQSCSLLYPFVSLLTLTSSCRRLRSLDLRRCMFSRPLGNELEAWWTHLQLIKCKNSATELFPTENVYKEGGVACILFWM